MIDIKTVNFAHFKCINLLKIYLVFWGFEYDFFWNKNSAIKNLVKKKSDSGGQVACIHPIFIYMVLHIEFIS